MHKTTDDDDRKGSVAAFVRNQKMVPYAQRRLLYVHNKLLLIATCSHLYYDLTCYILTI